MSDRIAELGVVCPFIALDDDRDHRAPGPDHRHRCFAESPAAPRALAHQAAYCLTGAFPGCPTFVDWARREAAPVKVESPRSLRGPAASPRAASAAAGAVAGAAAAATSPTPAPEAEAAAEGPEPAASPVAPPAANDWTAPPPWGTAAGGAAAVAGAGAGATPPDDTPSFLAGRGSRPAAVPREPQDWEVEPDARADGEALVPPPRPVVEPRRVPVGYAPVASQPERRAGSRRQDPAAPTWEEPRHLEAYPSIRSRGGGGGLPRPLVFALIIVIAGVALFATPFLLRGLGGGGGEGASPTPSAVASTEPTPEPSPTPEPTPEEIVYVVKKGDTLSAIAARYDVTVDQILEANPSIKNPNSIAVGDKIVIPQPLPSEIVDGEITPAP